MSFVKNIDIIKRRIEAEIEEVEYLKYGNDIRGLSEDLDNLDESQNEIDLLQSYLFRKADLELLPLQETIAELLDQKITKKEIPENIKIIKSKSRKINGKQEIKSKFFDDSILLVRTVKEITEEDQSYEKDILSTDLKINSKNVYNLFLNEKNNKNIKMTKLNFDKIVEHIEFINTDYETIKEVVDIYESRIKELKKELIEIENRVSDPESIDFINSEMNRILEK